MSTEELVAPSIEDFIAILNFEAEHVQDVNAYVVGNGSNQDEERKARKRVVIENAAAFLTEHQNADNPCQLLSDHLYPQLHQYNVYSPESEGLGRVLWLLDDRKALPFRSRHKD